MALEGSGIVARQISPEHIPTWVLVSAGVAAVLLAAIVVLLVAPR
jgi:hypothetical protein